MAVNEHLLRFLLYARQAWGLSLDRTMTLGRQHVVIAPRRLARIAASADLPELGRLAREPETFCEALLKALGAQIVDSLDADSFEGATVIHDLNRPAPEALLERYDLVLDGGTIEHVFDAPLALRSAMQMVTVGGHFVSLSVANNFFGHGFYQFSPELFFRLLGPGNGFALRAVVACEAHRPRFWYAVADPEKLRRRVSLVNNRETFLMVLAKRTRRVDRFEIPQQSDYRLCWALQRTDARSHLRPWGPLERLRPLWNALSPAQQELVRRYLFGLRGLDPAFRRLDAYALSRSAAPAAVGGVTHLRESQEVRSS